MADSPPPLPPRQWEWLGLVPLSAGLYWLLAHAGVGWWLLSAVPGLLLITSGVSILLLQGDQRTLGLMAGGAVIGVLLIIPAWIVADFGTAFYALMFSAASLLAAGRLSLRREMPVSGAEEITLSTAMDFKAGLDEAMLGYFVTSAIVPSGAQAERMCEEALVLESQLEQRGWIDDPRGMHAPPPPPSETFVDRARLWGFNYEVLRFESGFVLPDGLPGVERWQSYRENAECHVRILRHPGPPRPWLLCVHGYRMGVPWFDFSLFSPAWLHHKLGLNLIQPVLPLHGPRKAGMRTGDRFLDGDLLDLLYAEMQSLWDLRRTIAWLRQNEGDVPLGALGFSLGGYNTALLAAYESSLDFAVAAIPVTDFAKALWGVLPAGHLRYFAARGLDEEKYRCILSTVSPLTVKPLLDPERLHIVAAAGDRIVPPSHPAALSQAWGRPATWYQGSHLSVSREREPRDVLRYAMSGAGWPVE